MNWRDHLPIVKKVVMYGRDGRYVTPYLTRYVLPRTRWGRPMVHVFHRGDADEECHDHPWDFYTLPLNPRGYVEEVQDTKTGARSLNLVRPFRWTFRKAEHAHRVLDLGTPFVTLVWVKGRRREWGFWCGAVKAMTFNGSLNFDPVILSREGLNVPMWFWVKWRTFIFGEK